MAVDTLMSNNLGRINPATGTGAGQVGKPGLDPSAATDFRNALDRAVQAPAGAQGSIGAQGLASLVQPQPTAASSLKFSTHAVERMRSRGIMFQPEMMRNIEGAVQKAAAKGSKDTLVLTGDSALIVSVKNNTVVTVMDRASMKDNVFTNIDSTVVL